MIDIQYRSNRRMNRSKKTKSFKIIGFYRWKLNYMAKKGYNVNNKEHRALFPIESYRLHKDINFLGY